MVPSVGTRVNTVSAASRIQIMSRGLLRVDYRFAMGAGSLTVKGIAGRVAAP
jgi:hypothetical protein